MLNCNNCNATLADDAKFCNNCGAKMPDRINCQSCGRPVAQGAVFCQGCGATPGAVEPINETSAEPTVVVQAPVEPTPHVVQPAPALQSPYQPSLNEHGAEQAVFTRKAQVDEPVMSNEHNNVNTLNIQPPHETQPPQQFQPTTAPYAPQQPPQQPHQPQQFQPTTAPYAPQQPPQFQPTTAPYAPQQQIETQQQVYTQNNQQYMQAGQSVGQPYAQGELVQAPKKPFPVKIVAIVAGVVALAIVAIIALNLVLATKSRRNVALYIKNGEINISSVKKNNPRKITSKLASVTLDEESKIEISSTVVISKDGKTIFYPDDLEYSDDGLTIYHRSLTNTKKDAVKIDASITSYHVNEKADKVVYLRGDNDKLYSYNMKDKNKIADDVSSYKVSDSGNRIVYLTNDGDLYLLDGKKDKEKIDSIEDIGSVIYESDDLSKIYYLKEDSIYVKELGKEKNRLVKEVTGAISVYESGEMYFYKDADETSSSLMDYVTDDLKESDAAMKDPVKPEFPKYPSYSSDTVKYKAAMEKYNEAVVEYNKAYTKYREDYELHYEKTRRDTLRERLLKEIKTKKASKLMYFDGKIETVISEGFIASRYTYSNNKAALVYNDQTAADIPKVKMSEISSVYDVQEKIEAAGAGKDSINVAVGAKSSALESEGAKSFIFNEESSALYFFEEYDERTFSGDLYEAKINKDGVSKPELYDDDVFSSGLYFEGKSLLYLKNVKNNSGDLYLNKKEVDFGVSNDYISYDADFKEIQYLSDWNSDKEKGTLKVYNGKKSTTISEEVHDYTFSPGGEMLYLKDYRTGGEKGDLYVNKGGTKSTKIDDDVTMLLRVYSHSGLRN